MPKYQIILESDKTFSDDELMKELIDSDSFIKNRNHARELEDPNFITQDFKLLYAQSLEGIKKELWEKKEFLKENSAKIGANYQVEETFKEISNLFKLD